MTRIAPTRDIAVFRTSFGKIFKNTWCSYIHVVLNVIPHQISLVVFIYYMKNTGFLHTMILLRLLLLPIFLAEYLLHGTRLRVTFSSAYHPRVYLKFYTKCYNIWETHNIHGFYAYFWANLYEKVTPNGTAKRAILVDPYIGVNNVRSFPTSLIFFGSFPKLELLTFLTHCTVKPQ